MKAISENKKELLVYAVLWGIIFVAPVLSIHFHAGSNSTLTAFPWNSLFMVWRQCLIFFVIFLIHNFLLAPQLIYHRRRLLYFSSVAAVVALFIVAQCARRPDHQQPHQPPHEQELSQDRPPHDDFFLEDHPEDHEPPAHTDWEDGHPEPPHHEDMQKPLRVMVDHDMVATIILVLMMGMNLGIKFYFRQQKEQRTLALMKQQNLEQQLEYLKYQINPHFLMNTLNNIHALVDIDPERSKEAIIQLSKILRYVLYETGHERVPMSKEREFMDNYTELMRMRYGSKLDFSVSYPDEGTGVSVPPLLFISFVENAFKHGVSYQHQSFIAVDCKRYTGQHGDQRLLWTCRNSKHPKSADDIAATPRQGGVGLANVRQRLDLIYHEDYSLGVNETDSTYEVILDIPLEVQSKNHNHVLKT